MATAGILVAQRQITIIAILIHGRIIVPTEIPVVLMEINTPNIVTHQQQITIEKDLMTAALMRVAVETAVVHLVLLTEQNQIEMGILSPM